MNLDILPKKGEEWQENDLMYLIQLTDFRYDYSSLVRHIEKR